MRPKKQTIDELMNGFFDHMRSINRTEHSLDRYRRKWRTLKEFMAAKKIKYYDEKVERAFLEHELGQ